VVNLDALTYAAYLGKVGSVACNLIDLGHLNRTTNSYRYLEVYTPEVRDLVTGVY
jgi:hypothetical protein